MRQTIDVRFSHYSSNKELHTDITKPISIDSITHFENFNKIDLKTSRGISVLQYNGRNIVYQSGGYSYNRGMYADMFKVENVII